MCNIPPLPLSSWISCDGHTYTDDELRRFLRNAQKEQNYEFAAKAQDELDRRRWIGKKVKFINRNYPYYRCIGEVIGIERGELGLGLRIRMSFGRELVYHGSYLSVYDWTEYSDDELRQRYEEIGRDGDIEDAQLCREEMTRRGLN